MTRGALILALAASMLWPWGVMASACHESRPQRDNCCATRCCCCETGEDAAPCGCDARQAPSEPTDRAPTAPTTSSAELDRALDLSPAVTVDLAHGASVRHTPAASAASGRVQGGRSVLLQACRLRH